MAGQWKDAHSLPRVWKALVIAGLLGCEKSTGFIPATHRLAACRPITYPSPSTCCMVSKEMSRDDGLNSRTTHSRPASRRNNSLRDAAAACLATATILSSCMPPDATALGFSSTAGDGGSGSIQKRHGAPITLVLSEEESATIAPGAISSGEPTDVPSLLSELKGGRDAKATLGTMIKINDIVDADEDAVLEDSVAKQNLVKGLIDKRRARGQAWDDDTEVAFGILKRKLDPFNVVLLRPYLQIAPFLGGTYYLAIFFVQQKFRGFFPFAYFAAVAVFVAPAAILVLNN